MGFVPVRLQGQRLYDEKAMRLWRKGEAITV